MAGGGGSVATQERICYHAAKRRLIRKILSINLPADFDVASILCLTYPDLPILINKRMVSRYDIYGKERLAMNARSMFTDEVGTRIHLASGGHLVAYPVDSGVLCLACTVGEPEARNLATVAEARAYATLILELCTAEENILDEKDAVVLTPQERIILQHLACGFSNKEVARRLNLSVRTVETHRLNLRRKTRTGRLNELVTLARRMGLVPMQIA